MGWDKLRRSQGNAVQTKETDFYEVYVERRVMSGDALISTLDWNQRLAAYEQGVSESYYHFPAMASILISSQSTGIPSCPAVHPRPSRIHNGIPDHPSFLV